MAEAEGGMPERDQETLDLFIAESLEALDRIERLLLAAEEGTVPRDMLATLFRDIHTIKGTSGFLALRRILSLSHAAEDLMAKLRDGGLAMTPSHIGCLMEVADRLRRMVESVRDNDASEGDFDPAELVDRLHALMEDPPEVEAVQAAAEPSAPAPAPAPEAEAEAEVAAAPFAATPFPVAAAPADAEPAAASTSPAGSPLVGRLTTEMHPVVPNTTGEHRPVGRMTGEHVAVSGLAAEAPADPAREDGAQARPDLADGSVRVSVGVLDRLMNLMGELVLARNQIVQIVKTTRDGNAAAQAASQRLSLVTSDLQEQIMKTRMQPMSRVFERIPRMVRDLCQSTGKKVVTKIEGNATEIDKALVEAIRDPVMHIVRNAVDHGMELPEVREARGKPPVGQLKVRAAHEAGVVSIEIEDDGRGMDPVKLRAHAISKGVITAAEAERISDREALDLCFRPGFSTAESVTDISGRGVGMDVVRTHVERAGGQVELDSTVGKGTTLRLKMPLTLAIIPALLVRAGGQRFAIPQAALLELVYLNEEQARSAIEGVRGAPIYRLRGEVLPLVYLDGVLGLASERQSLERGVSIVVVAVGARRYGLVVDEIHDTEEIVIKPLHGQLKRLSCYSGATVLGDGGVALILEVAGLAAMSGIDVSSRRAAEVQEVQSTEDDTQPHIVFIAGDDARCAVPLAMVARLEQIAANTIERVAGREVVQYRGATMPIIRPEAVLPIGEGTRASGEQQLIVFDFGQPVGMAVGEIIDVVQLPAQIQTGGNVVPMTLGDTVVFGRTTMLVDVYAIVRQLVPHFEQVNTTSTSQRGARALLADDSNAMRAAISSYLRASGIEVVEVTSGDAAIRELRTTREGGFDVVVTDIEMAQGDGYDVMDMMRAERPGTPVIAWTWHDDPETAERARAAGARACINKMHREELIAALDEMGVARKKGAPRSEA